MSEDVQSDQPIVAQEILAAFESVSGEMTGEQRLQAEAEAFKAMLDLLIASILRRAEMVAAEFKENVRTVAKTTPDATKCTVRPYVRERQGRVEMSWYRVVYTSAPLVEGGVTPSSARHVSRHVLATPKGQKVIKTRLEPIPKGDSKDEYPASAFKGQPQWAQLMIGACEEQFALLRKEQKSLGLIRRRTAEMIKTRELFAETATSF